MTELKKKPLFNPCLLYTSDGKGAVLQIQCLHIHEEVVHGGVDAEVVGHRGQDNVTCLLYTS